MLESEIEPRLGRAAAQANGELAEDRRSLLTRSIGRIRVQGARRQEQRVDQLLGREGTGIAPLRLRRSSASREAAEAWQQDVLHTVLAASSAAATTKSDDGSVKRVKKRGLLEQRTDLT
jgi:hypothetical protein